MADLAKLVDELSALTVMEAADLSKMLEEKWGVSAAAAVAVKQQRIFLLGRLAGRIHADEHAHAVAAASAPVALDVRCIVFQISERLCHAKTRLVLCAIGELLVLLVDRCDKNRVQTPVF